MKLIRSWEEWQQGIEYIERLYDQPCDTHGVIIHIRKKYCKSLKNKHRDKPLRFFYGDAEYLYHKIRAFEESHPDGELAIYTTVSGQKQLVRVPFASLELMILPCLDVLRLKMRVVKSLIQDIEAQDKRKIERLIISQAHKITRVPIVMIDVDVKDEVLLKDVRQTLSQYTPITAWLETPNGYHLHMKITKELARAVFRDQVLQQFNDPVATDKKLVEAHFKPNHIYLIGTLKGGKFIEGEYSF